MYFRTFRPVLAGLLLACGVFACALPAGAQSLEIPETPLEKVPEAERPAAQRARTGKFAEYRKLAIQRAEAALKLQAFRKSLRGKEVTESDQNEVARLDQALSKAGDRLDEWAAGKELSPEDLAAMDYIQGEISKAAIEWAKKNSAP